METLQVRSLVWRVPELTDMFVHYMVTDKQSTPQPSGQQSPQMRTAIRIKKADYSLPRDSTS